MFCIIGGQSGGHLIPALEIARQKLANTGQPTPVILFNTTHSLDATIASSYSFITHTIKLKSGDRANTLIKIFQLMRDFFISIKTLTKQKPLCIISTGGIIALPVCIAGFMLNIPVELYVLDAIPGKAARWLAPFARYIFCVFSEAFSLLPSFSLCSNVQRQLCSYPVRFDQRIIDNPLNKMTILKTLNSFTHSRPTLFILGGSQGSVSLNALIIKIVDQWQGNFPFQIIHQTGPNTSYDWHTWYAKHRIPAITFPFEKDLSSYYFLSDIIIARAGSGLIHEALAFKKKTLLVPLITTTTNHQLHNALSIIKRHPHLFFLTESETAITKILLQSTH